MERINRPISSPAISWRATVTDRDEKLIRNSTAEFLIFTGQAGEQSIEAR